MKRRSRRNHRRLSRRRWHLLPSGDRTLSQLAEQFDLHPNQITSWKTQLGAALVRPGVGAAAFDMKTLHANIGEVALENDFLEGAHSEAGLLRASRRAHDLTELLGISRDSVYYRPGRCRRSALRSCNISIGCIWNFPSLARACCEACWRPRGTELAVVP
jgi:transposase